MSFDGLLIDHMKVIQITNPGEWSEPVEAVGDPIPCRIMYDTRLMKNYKGEEVLSAAKIFVKPVDITFYHEDGIQLDDESYARNHPIIIIKKPQNSVIIHHAEVWIQ
ncbi:unnamed protein product [marine sediment metagenome]|uniref:Uncharacterized protein n=1 Tax=marine sediment metagenome TaxID=412755 RepID=X1BEC8_9ZZZZ